MYPGRQGTLTHDYSGMLPLYEAVANSIHAIEDAEVPIGQGKITVQIIRDDQATLSFEEDAKRPGPEAKGEITGFKITDNGIGFNEVNMQSFNTFP